METLEIEDTQLVLGAIAGLGDAVSSLGELILAFEARQKRRDQQLMEKLDSLTDSERAA